MISAYLSNWVDYYCSLSQLYNIPKIFDLERGGDLRCFILDNHRPLHLANIYSRHSVVVFDDRLSQADEQEGYQDDVPCDGSDLSGGITSSDDESESESDADEDEEGLFDEVSINCV